MSNTMTRGIGPTLLAAAALSLSAAAWGAEPQAEGKSRAPAVELKKENPAVTEARHSLATFLKADPDLQKKLDSAVGYAILPNVTKGAVGIGAASGHGVLFENGKATGSVELNQVTVGLSLGGQAYSELVLFEDHPTLDAFKRSQFSMSAQVSAVAASAGASLNANYTNGVMVYTIAKGGLMYEASVGGQKFTFTPWQTAESVG